MLVNDIMGLMQTHARVASDSHAPATDELAVRPPTELDQLRADIKQRMRQLAAGWVHANSDEQTYREWMAWCIQNVRGTLQRLPCVDPRRPSLGFHNVIRDICKAAWGEVREFRLLLRSFVDAMRPSLKPGWLRGNEDRSAPDLNHELGDEVLGCSAAEEPCHPVSHML